MILNNQNEQTDIVVIHQPKNVKDITFLNAKYKTFHKHYNSNLNLPYSNM